MRVGTVLPGGPGAAGCAEERQGGSSPPALSLKGRGILVFELCAPWQVPAPRSSLRLPNSSSRQRFGGSVPLTSIIAELRIFYFSGTQPCPCARQQNLQVPFALPRAMQPGTQCGCPFGEGTVPTRRAQGRDPATTPSRGTQCLQKPRVVSIIFKQDLNPFHGTQAPSGRNKGSSSPSVPYPWLLPPTPQ